MFNFCLDVWLVFAISVCFCDIVLRQTASLIKETRLLVMETTLTHVMLTCTNLERSIFKSYWNVLRENISLQDEK